MLEYIHEKDRPSLKNPLWVIRFEGCAGLDEQRHEDLRAVQNASHGGVRERTGPDLIVSAIYLVAQNLFARWCEVFRVGILLDGFFVVGKVDERLCKKAPLSANLIRYVRAQKY